VFRFPVQRPDLICARRQAPQGVPHRKPKIPGWEGARGVAPAIP